MEKVTNANGLAIVTVLKAHKGEVLAYAEICALANIEAKTGYLTAAKKLAKIEKVENGVTVTIKTVTTYATGLTVEKEKTATVDGYTIAE